MSAILYELNNGDVGEEVCYWKDMTLLPHLMNLISKRGPGAFISFSEFENGESNRKVLARQLHTEVSAMKDLISHRFDLPTQVA